MSIIGLYEALGQLLPPDACHNLWLVLGNTFDKVYRLW